MSENLSNFADCYDLKRLKYFQVDDAGRLVIRKEEVGTDIIDFHTHLGLSFAIGPRINLFKKVDKVEYFFPYRGNPINMDVYSAFCFTPQSAKKCAYECIRSAWSSKGYMGTHTIPNMLEDMDRNCITHAVVLAVDYPRGISNNSANFLKHIAYEPRLIGYGYVHPYDSNRAEKVDKWLKMGAKGIKLHPAQTLFRANNRRLWEIYERCQERGVPVLFHSGHSPLAPNWQADFPAIKYFKEPLENFPKLKFIFGHSGIEEYQQVIELGKKHENVYMEVSGQPPHRIREMVNGIGSDRVLYGSDWPFYAFEYPLAKVLIATEGNQELRRKILYENAHRLLKEVGAL